jgi:adenosylcobinamide-phosphate synthase
MATIEDIFFYLPLVVLSAYIVDLLLGDPTFLPHPVRWMGRLITLLEGILRSVLKTERLAGVFLGIIVVAVVLGLTAGLLYLAAGHSIVLFLLISFFLGWSVLSIKSLKKEALEVIEPLKNDDLDRARGRLSRIVGRDTV